MKLFLFITLLVSVVSCGLLSSGGSSKKIFITWDSLEPDKWSSVWLIKRHIDPESIIEVRPTGSALAGGTSFGVPDAKYKRSGTQSTFGSLLAGFSKSDPILHEMGRIITTIETTAWNAPSDPLVHTVEQNFRRLQDRYTRVYVPISCYGEFFDVLYDQLARETDLETVDRALIAAVENNSCDQLPSIAKHKEARRVKELEITQLLSEVALNNNVVFVDTREPAEFKKSHIPNAINIPMRDLTPEIYEALKEADRVISYCVKDFRGYEVARKMKDNGVTKVAVMKPHGLSGWTSMGLPLASSKISDDEAQKHLMLCAKDLQLCLKPAS